jgi:hypothetical protein
MNRWALALACTVTMLATGPAGAQTERALLIGINTYQPAGTQAQHPAGCAYGRCELGTFPNLEGAVSDAQAMADVLTSPKFGFPAANVVLLTNPASSAARPDVVQLPAAQSSRDGILMAMQKYLVELPGRGDTVVFYDASHGSLRLNSKGSKLTVLVNGRYVHADSTLVPADAYLGGFDIRDREMSRIFNAALDKGVHLTVIFDSCHSGAISRGIRAQYRERTLPFDPRDIAEGPDLLADGRPRPAPTERRDNPALVFSAAQQDQTAKERPPSASATEPHGAFTAALIEALQVLPADTPASLLYQRVRAVLEGSEIPDQEPDLDAGAARRGQPLFGGMASASGRIRAAAIKTGEDGSVWLDIGRVAGIGEGSEFTSVVPGPAGESVRLRVNALEGIARSSAEVVSPSGAVAAPGELFELTRWSAVPSAPLRLWHWTANLSQAEILAAAAQIEAAGVRSISDPAEQPWTHMLSWDGTHWRLEQAGAAGALTLDPPLSGGALKAHLPANARLWINLPPSRELAASLGAGDPNAAVQSAENLADAHYALTGVLGAQGPAYAWYHKSELVAGTPASGVGSHSPGCSPSSPYPVRSDWVAIDNAGSIAEGGAVLVRYASLLAKVHGWLELADSPAGASSADYYSLALMPASGNAPLPTDTPARQGELLRMALISSERVIEKRWVYVLDIDCHGKGTVLYPGNYAENQFPNAADYGRQLLLPGARSLRIGPPYGLDTLILLSTAQPLPDPYALNFEGVASRGPAAAQSPLQRLLTQTSAGTRGFSGEVPTNWGIGVTSLRSIPKDATQ